MSNSLTHYQQGPSVTRLPDLVDRLFRESFVAPAFFDRNWLGGTATPSLPMNLVETPDGYVMHAALPGMNTENLDIQVMGREVSIKGKYEITAPENGTWIWQGITTGEFFQTFTLPLEVDGDQVQANYENGILYLTLPKAEHVRPKSIKVNVTK